MSPTHGIMVIFTHSHIISTEPKHWSNQTQHWSISYDDTKLVYNKSTTHINGILSTDRLYQTSLAHDQPHIAWIPPFCLSSLRVMVWDDILWCWKQLTWLLSIFSMFSINGIWHNVNHLSNHGIKDDQLLGQDMWLCIHWNYCCHSDRKFTVTCLFSVASPSWNSNKADYILPAPV